MQIIITVECGRIMSYNNYSWINYAKIRNFIKTLKKNSIKTWETILVEKTLIYNAEL